MRPVPHLPCPQRLQASVCGDCPWHAQGGPASPGALGRGLLMHPYTHTYNPRAAGDEAPLPNTLCGSVLSPGLGQLLGGGEPAGPADMEELRRLQVGGRANETKAASPGETQPKACAPWARPLLQHLHPFRPSSTDKEINRSLARPSILEVQKYHLTSHWVVRGVRGKG